MLFVCCVGSDLCDVPIACSEESYRVCVRMRAYVRFVVYGV